jgi:hypothetical protein
MELMRMNYVEGDNNSDSPSVLSFTETKEIQESDRGTFYPSTIRIIIRKTNFFHSQGEYVNLPPRMSELFF